MYSDLVLCIVQYIFRTYSDIFRHICILFRHIQPYCGMFSTLCNSCIFKTLPYSEPWHIQNPQFIKNSVKAYYGIFRTLCNPPILRTLPYSEPCYVQNFGIFRILFIQAHILTYSVMIVIITSTVFHFNLTYFSTKFKTTYVF